MEKVKISVVVHTYNAAATIEQTLRSLEGFDEILVCDMYSTDGTLEILERYKCRVIFHEYTGGIPEPIRDWAIRQTANDWVFVVDADETITPELRGYLYELAGSGQADGAFIARRNFFMGRFMHAAYPDYILRFFRKSCSYWPTTIHSQPVVDGKVIRLPKRHKELAFTHLNDPPLADVLSKMNLYTTNEVPRRARKRKNFSLFKTWLSAVSRFCSMYFVRGGFRDGRAGFIFAVYQSFIYKFLTLSKLWELEADADKKRNWKP